MALCRGCWETGEANDVFLARSGQPFTLVVNSDIANISGNGGTVSGYGQPNLVGNPHGACTVSGVSLRAGSEGCYFNPAAFAVPVGSFGNLGRDVFRDEPYFNMDFSLAKTIPFGETRSIQLRFESFNIFKFQILGTPATTVTYANARQIRSIAGTPGELQ
jgi:hypothetical protein